MNKILIKRNMQIAIGLLASSTPNRYGNGKVSHFERDYLTSEVIELLEEILIMGEKFDIVIISKQPANINPPEES
jgi:hypothetical protein